MPDKLFLSRLGRWVQANHAALTEARQRQDWCRSLRRAQGITGRELAQRLGVSPARISVLERDELKGAVTLKMLQRAAQALDCELVYMLVPKASLQPPRQHKPRVKVRQSHE